MTINTRNYTLSVLAVLVAAAVILFLSCSTNAYAPTSPAPYASRVHWGDCGVDLYPVPQSGAAGYCYIPPAEPTALLVVDEALDRGNVINVTPQDPQVIDRDDPQDDPQADTPVDTPRDDTPQDKPAAKQCKNKNAGKDGTPAECNAGKGQEKHNK